MKRRDFKKNILIIFISFVILIAVTYSIYIFICKRYIYPIKYEKYVLDAAKENHVDPYLVFAVIKQESNFDKNACSNKNAQGLMQILENTAKEVAQDNTLNLEINNLDLYDAKTNIYIGTKYLKMLIERYNGDIWLALCAYNAGLGNVDKWILSDKIYSNYKLNISMIPFGETKEYLVNVLKYYNKYVDLYSDIAN